jgi:hypothetical protein
MADTKRNMPMDPNAMEGEAAMHTNNPRNAYALDQLIEEVEALFPDVHYELGHRSARHVAHSVRFDLTDNTMDLRQLLVLMGDPAYNEDVRIEEVVADAESVLVIFRPNATTMDDRTPFGIGVAYGVLTETDQSL